MPAMNRSSRLTNVLFTFLGAASVGLVIAVLAIAGVFDQTERIVREVPRESGTPVSQPREAGAPGSVSDIYARTAPGVAFIAAEGAGGAGGPGGTGSGFLIDGQGHVVTNQHVVDSANRLTVRFGEDGEPLSAKLVGEDASTDLAVLEVDPKKISAETKPLELSSSSELRPGDEAIAIGSPFGLSGTVTTGIISALNRDITSPNGFPISGVLQTDAAINPGNSGGPLLDGEGRVIGVNSQIAASESAQSSGVGFAVPVDTVKEIVPQLLEHGEIKRAYLGVTTRPDQTEDGAVVYQIAPGGPVAATDLRPGDRIVKIEDRAIKEPGDLSDAVLDFKPGDRVSLAVERGGDQRTIDVQLGDRPDQPVQR
jgi:S1-C subfamily serine protease